MFDFLFFMIAMSNQPPAEANSEDTGVVVFAPLPQTETATNEGAVVFTPLPQGDQGGSDSAVVFTPLPTAPALQAEPQVATGRFLTALEVKPILTATKPNWVAVRDFNGQDLLYVTHLWSWRCGLAQMEVSVNGTAYEIWPLPACHDQTAVPNAILPEDGLPYRAYPPGSIAQISVRVTYDDLSEDEAAFPRAMVELP